MPSGSRGSRMLLVDDEPDILESLRFLLRAELPGLEVRTATSGAQALQILGTEGADLVVADYRMPGMDGLQFLSRARLLQPNVPHMMMTAYPDADLRVRAFKECGVANFLTKPLNVRVFVRVISAAIEGPSLKQADEGSQVAGRT